MPQVNLQNVNIWGVAILSACVVLGLLAIAIAWAWAIVRLASGHRLLPANPIRRVPWGIVSVILAGVLWVGMQFLVVQAYARTVIPPQEKKAVDAANPPPKPPEPNAGGESELSPRDQLWVMTIINLLLIPLIPMLLRATSGARLADLGLVRHQADWNLLRGVVACLLLAPIVYGVNYAALQIWKVNLHPVADAIRSDPSGLMAALTFLSAVVLAPAVEELLFRGVLLGWLLKLWPSQSKPVVDIFEDLPAEMSGFETASQRANESYSEHESHEPVHAIAQASAPVTFSAARIWVPNLIVSALFGVLHFKQWPAPIPIFVLSLGLGYLYARTGSLVASMALHATFNGIGTTAMFLVVRSGLLPPG